MYRSETALLSVAILIASAGFAQTHPKSTPPHSSRPANSSAKTNADNSQEPYVIERLHTAIRFENDGTGERVSSIRIRIQSGAAAEKFGELAFPFSALNEKVEVHRVAVHKRDGSIKVVPNDAVRDVSADAKTTPAFPGESEKRVAIAGLTAGDTLEYEIATRLLVPFAANQFWTEYRFIRDAIVLDEQVELNLPQGRAFSVKGPGYSIFDRKVQSNAPAAKGVSFSRADSGDRAILRWRHASLTHDSGDEQERAAAEARTAPDIQLTTFTNWQEVARWEAGFWKDKTQPSAEVTAKAAALTDGLTEQNERVRALYAFVSKNIRFVSSSFGSEHFGPRSATEVLSSGYGDWADAHALLVALLNAAGIRAETALMPAARKLDTTLPSPAQLQRVLTVIPVIDPAVWLDPSAEVAPFDFIPMSLRGESALLVGRDGAATIVKTPADPPFASTQKVEIDGTVSDLGKLSGTIRYSVRGDSEFVLRTAFRRTPQSQWNQLAQTVLALDGLHGEVVTVKPSDPEDTEKPFELQVAFSQQSFLDWSSKTMRAVLPLLTIGMPDPPIRSQTPIELGTPLRVATHLSLKFPPQFSPQAPVGTEVKRDYAEFSSAYRFENGVLTADRSLNFKLREVPADRAADYRAFTRAVNADETQSLAVNNSDPHPGTIPGNASADEVFDAGTAAMKSGNVNAAIPLFERVTEIAPKHAHAWNDLGLAYLRAGRSGDAVSAFQKQLEVNPSDEHANNYLGVAFEQEHRDDEAAAAFRKQIALNPLDTVAHGALGTILLEQHDPAGAVAELEKATILSPESAAFDLSLGRAYLESGANQKGIDALRKAVDLSPTATVWNNAAYNLADHGVDLDEALTYAESAVKSASERLAGVNLSHVTQNDFTHTANLTAYWDTLGWVYFRKGDLATAEKYLRGAWLAGGTATSCDHLAQVYEKRGEKERAAHAYAIALSKPDADPDSRARLTLLLGGNAQVDALVANARDTAGNVNTLKVTTDSTATGSADFLVLLSARRSENGAVLSHVEDVKFVAGSESFRPLASALRSLDYGAMFPAVSPAKLLIRGRLACSGSRECLLGITTEAVGDSAH